jgi:hypothetical protein
MALLARQTKPPAAVILELLDRRADDLHAGEAEGEVVDLAGLRASSMFAPSLARQNLSRGLSDAAGPYSHGPPLI